jgi:hypothetical protein
VKFHDNRGVWAGYYEIEISSSSSKTMQMNIKLRSIETSTKKNMCLRQRQVVEDVECGLPKNLMSL